MDKPTIKILMTKGEKGDAYDDSELRAELEAILANNAYVVAIEDGAFELPIHTINDDNITAYSCWSSAKVNNELADVKNDILNLQSDLNDEISNLQINLNKRKQVIYTLNNINATTATCNLTYDEIKNLITNNINYSVSVKLGTSYYTAYEVINGGNIGVMVNIPEEDKKVMVSHSSNNTITVASGASDIATINNKVNPLWAMRWIDGGNVTNTDGIFVPWSSSSASTVLILCMNNSDNRCCQVFLARKTMSSDQRAIRLCGASDTLGVYADISQSQGVLVALADDVTPYPTGAQIYYQYIDL